MIEFEYSPNFIRRFNRQSPQLQQETLERIELFKSPKNHQSLRTHKLKGRLKEFYSFSINYRYRIIFEWSKGQKTAHLHYIGDHGIYE